MNANKTECQCHAGFGGKNCHERTMPVTLSEGSYAKIALSFTPDPVNTRIAFRIRTRQLRGTIIQLAAHHNTAALSIEVS